jgi:hypothetical protein
MKTKLFIIIAAISMAFASCTKYPPDSGRLTEDLVVYTKYNTSANFNQYKTFAIVDSISYVSTIDSGKVMNDNTKAVLDRIVKNMESRGFSKVSHLNNPDLGINVGVVKTTNVDVYYPGWYWGYYDPYYWGYPGGGYYYPYYPTYITSYSAGSLLIDLVDFKNPTADNKFPVEWMVFIRALVTDNHSISQIQTSIDQAFTQTPAIKTSLNK